MATPIAHAIVGMTCLSVTHIIWPRCVIPIRISSLFVFAVLGCLPDIDLVFSYLLMGSHLVLHSGPTHSFFFAFIIAVILCLLAPHASGQQLKIGAMIGFAVASHVIIDWFSGRQIGFFYSHKLAPFWPFFKESLSLPITLFKGVTHGGFDVTFSWLNIKLVIYELLLFLPIFLGTLFFTYKFKIKKK
jgi:hypothetical protein